MSFPCCSSGGLDGLRPQHLKDMIGPSGDGAADNLVQSLTAFAALVLSGEVPVSIRPFFLWRQHHRPTEKGWRNSPHCCWLHPSSSCCQGGWCQDDGGNGWSACWPLDSLVMEPS